MAVLRDPEIHNFCLGFAPDRVYAVFPVPTMGCQKICALWREQLACISGQNVSSSGDERVGVCLVSRRAAGMLWDSAGTGQLH